MSEVMLVMTAVPDEECAARIAEAILDARLAACVSRLAPCVSAYWWKGAKEAATEWPLLIKAPAERYVELEACIRLHHPYEIPEIVALPVIAGLPDWMRWVHAEARGLA